MFIRPFPFTWKPQAQVTAPPNAPARTLRNKGDAEPIDVTTLLVRVPSSNTKPKPKNVEADFLRAKLRRSVLPTFADELNRIEGLPLISDPTNPPDPGGWLRTPENDAPRS